MDDWFNGHSNLLALLGFFLGLFIFALFALISDDLRATSIGIFTVWVVLSFVLVRKIGFMLTFIGGAFIGFFVILFLAILAAV